MRALPRLARGLSRHGWGLCAEAVLELGLARAATLLPAHRYLTGVRIPEASAPAEPERVASARRVGAAVSAVADRMPFRALCLQQAMATRRMLERRGYATSLCLGVNTAREARKAPQRGMAAHAWLCVGHDVVCGESGLDRYAVVARFG